MQDDFDADGYEPEHDQYLDNDDEPSEALDEDEGASDDEPEDDAEQKEVDPDDQVDLEDELDHWSDL